MESIKHTKVRVKVTEEDIRNGKRKWASRCPVALALRRETKSCWAVAGSEAYSHSLGWFDTSAVTLRFIRRFDKGKPVKPFTAVLWMSAKAKEANAAI